MIRITIEGDRGEGKTTTAIAIQQMLAQKGQKVTYEGLQDNDTEAIRRTRTLNRFSEQREFVVVDKHAFDGDRRPLIAKLKTLFETFDTPKRQLNKLRVAAAVAEVAALIDEASDLPAEAFAMLPVEARKGAFQIFLGAMIAALE